MGRKLELPSTPKKVISLVPSITEFLIDIGAEVVGRTKFCIYPEDKVKDIPVIGGTKNFRFDVIEKLRPDLIIGNKEENYEEGIDRLSEKFPVWMSDIYNFQDASLMMKHLGDILELRRSTDSLLSKIKDRYTSLADTDSGRVIYLIWRNPWIAVGKDTYIDAFLTHLGFENEVTASRYPEFGVHELQDMKPETVLLSSEPYPFKRRHLAEIKQIFPTAKMRLVNGEFYSWYGTRILKIDS